jgi:hypothetical protein
MPVQVTVIWLSPGVVAVPITGCAAGRVTHVVGGHCPAPLPAGKVAYAMRVDHWSVTS